MNEKSMDVGIHFLHPTIAAARNNSSACCRSNLVDDEELWKDIPDEVDKFIADKVKHGDDISWHKPGPDGIWKGGWQFGEWVKFEDRALLFAHRKEKPAAEEPGGQMEAGYGE